MSKRAKKVTLDPSHPAHSLFELLPSDQRYRALSTKTARHRNSIFPRPYPTWTTHNTPQYCTSVNNSSNLHLYIKHMHIVCANTLGNKAISDSDSEWLLSDWGVLLLDVIMNIAVVIYSCHLSGWRLRGLHFFLKGTHLPIVAVQSGSPWNEWGLGPNAGKQVV